MRYTCFRIVNSNIKRLLYESRGIAPINTFLECDNTVLFFLSKHKVVNFFLQTETKIGNFTHILRNINKICSAYVILFIYNEIPCNIVHL